MNLRPSGYEPDELPGCSTPRQWLVSGPSDQPPGQARWRWSSEGVSPGQVPGDMVRPSRLASFAGSLSGYAPDGLLHPAAMETGSRVKPGEVTSANASLRSAGLVTDGLEDLAATYSPVA